MSKKAAAGIAVAVVLLVTLVACVFANDWDNSAVNEYDMHTIDYGTHDGITTDSIIDAAGNLNPDSLNFVVFEEYGPLMIILAILMFGAMVGGICIAREEQEEDDE